MSTTKDQTQHRQYETVASLSKRLGVSPDAILGWIHSGELQAVNVARKLDGQLPRWRIPLAAIERFEAGRTSVQETTKQPRRKRTDENVEKFF